MGSEDRSGCQTCHEAMAVFNTETVWGAKSITSCVGHAHDIGIICSVPSAVLSVS